jgi:WD40 repeat protein
MINFELIASLSSGQVGKVSALSFSPSGRELVSVAGARQIGIWRTAKWEEESILRSDEFTLEQILFVNDWTFYAFGVGTALRYQIFGPEIKNIYHETPGGRIQTISPDEKWIAAMNSLDGIWGMSIGDDEPFLVLHRPKSKEDPIQLKAKQLGRRMMHINPYTLRFSPDSSYLAIGIELNDIEWECRLYVLSLAECVDEEDLLSEVETFCRIEPFSFSADTKFLAYGNMEDNSINVMKLSPSIETQRFFYGHEDSITGLTFHPNGNLLASASNDKTVRIWDIRENSMIGVYLHIEAITTIAFHPKGDIFAIGDEKGNVSVIQISGI